MITETEMNKYSSLKLCISVFHGLDLFLSISFSNRFGFYKYMKMDEEEDDRPFFFPNPDGEFSCVCDQ